ncbi:MAG: hypothetical protein ABIQ31_03865 [Ferruginibacter sp.]
MSLLPLLLRISKHQRIAGKGSSAVFQDLVQLRLLIYLWWRRKSSIVVTIDKLEINEL